MIKKEIFSNRRNGRTSCAESAGSWSPSSKSMETLQSAGGSRRRVAVQGECGARTGEGSKWRGWCAPVLRGKFEA